MSYLLDTFALHFVGGCSLQEVLQTVSSHDLGCDGGSCDQDGKEDGTGPAVGNLRGHQATNKVLKGMLHEEFAHDV